MGFVIHWHESAIDLHVFPIPIPPPTSLSTRYHLFSGLVPEGFIKLYVIVQLYVKQIASGSLLHSTGSSTWYLRWPRGMRCRRGGWEGGDICIRMGDLFHCTGELREHCKATEPHFKKIQIKYSPLSHLNHYVTIKINRSNAKIPDFLIICKGINTVSLDEKLKEKSKVSFP